MTSDDASQAVTEWITERVPALIGTYDHVPAEKAMGLPDAVVQILRTGVQMGGGERFAFWDIQQRAIYAVEMEVSFMVDNSDTQAAAALLREWENTLLMGVMGDPTLGGRVPFASPLVEFDFTAPFVEYEDGTRGREMTMTLAVGDLVEAN